MIIVRFPPSPTGFLHIGNARVAIINWLFAKKTKGKILLRFDDTDTERVKEEYKTQMLEDLNWLGIEFDEFFTQSSRQEIYEDAFRKCIENGFIYPCYETEEELEIKRKIALANGKPPLYKQIQFSEEQKKNPPYYRFKLTGEKTEWNDEIQGHISYEVKDLSDPVILRANGNFMYTFCSVVDDFLTNITHIIRGADHITNTAIQIQIFNALAKCYGKPSNINFAHLPLFQSKEGKISKRVGGFSIMEMRKSGIEAETIINVLAKIGLSYYDDNFKSIPELMSEFDIVNFNKSQIYFDFNLLESFNKKCIMKRKFADVKGKLPSFITETFFEKMKENVSFLHEIIEWHKILHDENLSFHHLLNDEDKAFVSKITNLIEEIQAFNWQNMMQAIKQQFPERKGKSLFLPIRIALTGKEEGPEMHFLIEEVGKNLFKKRFSS
jgi:glutamyl-tRNA synthetase